MTDEEFAAGVDAILLTGVKGHAAHRALDLWWTRYALEQGGLVEQATRKWMAHIEGDHAVGKPYPLGRKWWQPFRRRPRPISVDEDNGWVMSCP